MKRKVAILMAVAIGAAVAACFKCRGTGKCITCGGEGYVYLGNKPRPCNTCNTTGICYICNGSGR